MASDNLSFSPHQPSWPIVALGIIALAIAMGIGRFAFTPLMPLMFRDGTIDAATGAEWAAINYLGYLVGALTASWFAHVLRRGIWMSLIGIMVTTFGMAWVGPQSTLVGVVLRGTAGLLSAWVLICTSSWCLLELARRQSTSMGGGIYTGVGLGIAVTGVITWLGGVQAAWLLWIELGLLALAGTSYVIFSLHREPSETIQKTVNVVVPPPKSMSVGQRNTGLVFCYGAFGFGYIIPATFLPTMARQLVSDPLVFGLTWPIFGMAATLSVAAASHWLSAWPRRKVWAVAQAVMALGTLLPLLQEALWVLAASAVLVGGTFMVATMAGLQLARELMPANPTVLLAKMTAGFAVGQIAGPVLVRVMGDIQIAGWGALDWANALATVLLATTAIWLWRSSSRLSEAA